MDCDYIWFNEEFLPPEEAKISFFSHSLHYGSAVFEGIRTYDTDEGPAIFRLDRHTERLLYSAEKMDYDVSYSKKEINKFIKQTVDKNNVANGYIRPIMFYGEKIGVDSMDAEENFAIAAWDWGEYLEEEAVEVKISNYKRIQPSAKPSGAKISGPYYNGMLATNEARKNDCHEALLLDHEGKIAEGAGENIFFVKDKTLFTPKTDTILPGITRDSVIEIADEMRFEVKEIDIYPDEMKQFEEAFFTGTAAEVNAIASIDDVEFNQGKEGEKTRKIREKYEAIIYGEDEKYHDWLTFIN